MTPLGTDLQDDISRSLRRVLQYRVKLYRHDIAGEAFRRVWRAFRSITHQY